MKKTVFIMLVILAAIQSDGFSQKKWERERVKSDTTSVDSLEYQLIIMDPGFDTWLLTKPAKEFYSNEYYAQKNLLYVAEWNLCYLTAGNKGLCDTYIDYNFNIDYGLEINYELYYYFKYFEETNHIRLVNTLR